MPLMMLFVLQLRSECESLALVLVPCVTEAAAEQASAKY
jgi:hypothetical protein